MIGPSSDDGLGAAPDAAASRRADRPLLTAAEAAARLGIKRQTLYAYVSRGVLHRTVSLDGKTSLFDPDAVDALRTRRQRKVPGEIGTVVASAITALDEQGPSYRGHAVLDLVADDVAFEAVADLLFDEPRWDDPSAQDDLWRFPPDLGAQIRAAQAALPAETALLDRLRVSVAVMSALDPLRHDLTHSTMTATGRRILCGMVAGLPKQHIGPHDRLADQLWLALATEAGSAAQRRALNAALVLLADHDLAASTFAVRVAASTRADPYSLVTTGLGAVGGVLHGAASSIVHRFLDEAAAIGPEAAFGRRLADDRRIPGTSHAIYRRQDARHHALLDLIRHGWSGDPRLNIVNHIADLAQTRLDQPPNIDLALGSLTWLANMDPSAGELFAIARTAGWLAHAMEELTEPPLRFRVSTRHQPQRPRLPED